MNVAIFGCASERLGISRWRVIFHCGCGLVRRSIQQPSISSVRCHRKCLRGSHSRSMASRWVGGWLSQISELSGDQSAGLFVSSARLSLEPWNPLGEAFVMIPLGYNRLRYHRFVLAGGKTNLSSLRKV